MGASFAKVIILSAFEHNLMEAVKGLWQIASEWGQNQCWQKNQNNDKKSVRLWRTKVESTEVTEN